MFKVNEKASLLNKHPRVIQNLNKYLGNHLFEDLQYNIIKHIFHAFNFL